MCLYVYVLGIRGTLLFFPLIIYYSRSLLNLMNKYLAHQSKYSQVLSASLILAFFLGMTPTFLFTHASAATPAATLNVVVQVVGGSALPEDFHITINATDPMPSAFSGSASGTLVSMSAGGLYAVDGGHVVHYNSTESPECFGVLTDSASATCTVTQTFSNTTSTGLRVMTRVINSHGGTNVPSDFIINVNGADATPSFFPGSNLPQEVSVTPGANMSVVVNSGQRYSVILSPDCSSAVAAEDTRTCNITFGDLALFVGGTDSPNLVPNSKLEVADANNATRPQGWASGWPWGANVATYTYPVTVPESSEISSGNAMSISYPTYNGDVLTGGDAKWYFAPVSVIPGHRYLYQDAYNANTPTYLIAEFFNAANEHLSNAGFNLVPSTEADTWKIASASFIAPPNAAFMTVYHQLNSAGTLTLDNVVLMETALPTEFAHGFVSLAFDDGYLDHFTNAKTILDAAGKKGTFFVISHVSGFGVTNPSLEIADPANAGKPLGWAFSGGLSGLSVYPVAGRTGNAVEFSSSNPELTSGWSTLPMSVFANENYEFSHYYKSTAASNVIIKATKDDGTVAYMQSDGGLVSAEVAYATLPAVSDWTQFKSPGLWIPPGVKNISMRYGLVASGTLDVDDVNIGAYRDFMTPDELRALQSEQHEIGGHTQTHADLTAVSLQEAQVEVSGSQQDFIAGGFAPLRSFAYPLGDNNDAIQNFVHSAGYTSGRGTVEGLNGKNANRYALMSKMVMSDTPMSQIQQLINGAVAGHSWLILTFHQILPAGTPGATSYTSTPERLGEILNYLTKNNISVSTVGEGADMMEGGVSVVDVVAPVIAAHANVEAVATSSLGVTVAYTLPTAIDDHDGSVAVTCAPTSGAFFPLGTTSVMCNAHDTSGNNAIQTSFTVRVSTTSDAGGIPPPPPPAPAPVSSGGGGGGGSATYDYWGCTNSTARNYNRYANRDDHSCVTIEVSPGIAPTTTGSIVPMLPDTGTVLRNEEGAVLGAATTTTYGFKKSLYLGSRGRDVMELQKHLSLSGHFKGPLSGYFGRLTLAAVKKFQQKHKIDAIGIVGPRTRAMLNQNEDAWVITSTPGEVILGKK